MDYSLVRVNSLNELTEMIYKFIVNQNFMNHFCPKKHVKILIMYDAGHGFWYDFYNSNNYKLDDDLISINGTIFIFENVTNEMLLFIDAKTYVKNKLIEKLSKG